MEECRSVSEQPGLAAGDLWDDDRHLPRRCARDEVARDAVLRAHLGQCVTTIVSAHPHSWSQARLLRPAQSGPGTLRFRLSLRWIP